MRIRKKQFMKYSHNNTPALRLLADLVVSVTMAEIEIK